MFLFLISTHVNRTSMQSKLSHDTFSIPARGVNVEHDSALHAAGFDDFMSARSVLQQYNVSARNKTAQRLQMLRKTDTSHLQRQHGMQTRAQRVSVHELKQPQQVLPLNRIGTANPY